MAPDDRSWPVEEGRSAYRLAMNRAQGEIDTNWTAVTMSQSYALRYAECASRCLGRRQGKSI